MIKDSFSVNVWKITILYDCTCDDIDYIIELLKEINCPNKYILQAIDNLESCNLDIGLTYSNKKLKKSIIVINKTSSIYELVNTISHEYFHLMCHLKDTFYNKNEEFFATLNGNLNMKSYKIIEKIFKIKVGSE